MTYIRVLPDGKSQVIKDLAFCNLLDNRLPQTERLFSDIFSYMDERIRTEDSRITREALSNVHGDWYEWLLAISAWNFCCENSEANLAILLPNVIQFEVATLYEERLYALIADLKTKVSNVANVQLITSNPDFVIIQRSLANEFVDEFLPIENITPQALHRLEIIYRHFISNCDYEQIKGYVSVKNSLRPDRRLQISHEGSLMKALYAHLQTREWITNPNGLKYFAIASRINEADRNALKTVATHSLTTVFSLPQAAVDEVFEVNSLIEARAAFSRILF